MTAEARGCLSPSPPSRLAVGRPFQQSKSAQCRAIQLPSATPSINCCRRAKSICRPARRKINKLFIIIVLRAGCRWHETCTCQARRSMRGADSLASNKDRLALVFSRRSGASVTNGSLLKPLEPPFDGGPPTRQVGLWRGTRSSHFFPRKRDQASHCGDGHLSR